MDNLIKLAYTDPYDWVSSSPTDLQDIVWRGSDETKKLDDYNISTTDRVLFLSRYVYSTSGGQGRPKPADENIIVSTHESHVLSWKNMTGPDRSASQVLRSYWLGESPYLVKPSQEAISRALVSGLAEIIRKYKANIYLSDLIPYNVDVAQKYPNTYLRNQRYLDYFEQNYGGSKHHEPVVKAFASGQSVKPIRDIAFGFETDVITAYEIEQVYAALKDRPEPLLEYRPSASTEKPVDKSQEEERKVVLQGIQALLNKQVEADNVTTKLPKIKKEEINA